MKVSELVKKLQALPQDAEVIVENAVSILDGGGYEYVLAEDAGVQICNVSTPEGFKYLEGVYIW